MDEENYKIPYQFDPWRWEVNSFLFLVLIGPILFVSLDNSPVNRIGYLLDLYLDPKTL